MYFFAMHCQGATKEKGGNVDKGEFKMPSANIVCSLVMETVTQSEGDAVVSSST